MSFMVRVIFTKRSWKFYFFIGIPLKLYSPKTIIISEYIHQKALYMVNRHKINVIRNKKNHPKRVVLIRLTPDGGSNLVRGFNNLFNCLQQNI